MDIIYLGDVVPSSFSKSVFLAGPTSSKVSWRPLMIEELRLAGYDGVVFVPEFKDPFESFSPSEDSLLQWERDCLSQSDVIIFWVDRDLEDKLFGLNTNLTFGEWYQSGKVVLGYPLTSCKVESLVRRISLSSFPLSVVKSGEMSDVVTNVLLRTSKGHVRSKGERYIPLELFHLPSFQSWLHSQHTSGNSLEHAKVSHLERLPDGSISLWVLRLSLFSSLENRLIPNEVVVGRSDSSSVVLLGGDLESRDPSLISVVLVRDFRATSRNSSPFLYESPRVSSLLPSSLAVQEVEKEVGLTLDPSRLVPVDVRQIFSSLLTSSSSVYTVRLTKEELDIVDSFSPPLPSTKYVEVAFFRSALDTDMVDWSQIGMISASIEALLNLSSS